MLKTRVLLVDDSALIRRSLRRLFETLPDLEVAGEAANGVQAIQLAHDLRPDVDIMDLWMPVMDGLTATRILTTRSPEFRVIILSACDGWEVEGEAAAAGAIACLSKFAGATVLLRALRSAE